MANYRCPKGHTWEGKSNLSKHFTPGELLCPEEGCGLQNEGLKSNGGGSSLRAAPEPAVIAEAHARFSQLVTEWPCFFADKVDGKRRRPDHECWPHRHRDPHHLIPATWIREHFGDLPDPELGDILYAPIIGVPLCRRAHEAVENRTEFIYRDELDAELLDFCRRIDRRYPGRPSLLERLHLESPARSSIPNKEGASNG
jgi:hypothetical protein